MPPTGVPLARSQETLWDFLRCFAPDDPGRLGYNVFASTRMAGPLDPDLFPAALADVVSRHDALRLVFDRVDDDPTVRFVDEVTPILTMVDLSGEPAARRSIRLGSLLGYERQRTFDLHGGPLWSVLVARVSAGEWVVAVSLCHLIADGWSTGVFLRDLDAAYQARAGRRDPLPPLDIGYAEATAPPAWDRTESRRRAEFWKRTLTPLPEAWPFTVAGPPADPVLATTTEASLSATLPGQAARALHALARQRRVTPFVLSLAAYRILLGGLTGWERVVLGTATSGRERPGSGDLIGQFTQNVYVATTLSPDTTLVAAIDEVRAATFAAMRHVASFTEIARAVHPGFDRDRPWPFLFLYHSWFQSAAPTAGSGAGTESTAGSGAGTVAGGGDRSAGAGDDIRERRSRGRRPTPADVTPDRLRHWAKRGEPGLTVSHDRRGIEMNFNPSFYDRDEVATAVRGYRAVLLGLLRDPHQRIRDLTLS